MVPEAGQPASRHLLSTFQVPKTMPGIRDDINMRTIQSCSESSQSKEEEDPSTETAKYTAQKERRVKASPVGASAF